MNCNKCFEYLSYDKFEKRSDTIHRFIRKIN